MPQRFEAAVHALFLGQYPQALQFERFIYLYMAIDACYRADQGFTVSEQQRYSQARYERIEWTCNELGVNTPTWAAPTGSGWDRGICDPERLRYTRHCSWMRRLVSRCHGAALPETSR